MKELLNAILNKNKKPVKNIGTIVAIAGNLKYVIETNTGRMQVESTSPYKVGDRVVVFDLIIQGYAGIEKPRKTLLV